MSERALNLIDQIEMHCPCGARPESLNTHPHVPGCNVDELKRLLHMLFAQHRSLIGNVTPIEP